jgi:hypothetical protein
MRGQIPEHLTKKMDNLNTQTKVEDRPWWGLDIMQMLWASVHCQNYVVCNEAVFAFEMVLSTAK